MSASSRASGSSNTCSARAGSSTRLRATAPDAASWRSTIRSWSRVSRNSSDASASDSSMRRRPASTTRQNASASGPDRRALGHHALQPRAVAVGQVEALAELHRLVEERADRQIEELLGLHLRARARHVEPEQRVALLLQAVQRAVLGVADQARDGAGTRAAPRADPRPSVRASTNASMKSRTIWASRRSRSSTSRPPDPGDCPLECRQR